MHSNELEDIQSATAGDIVAFFGVECSSGDTFTDGSIKCATSFMTKQFHCRLTSLVSHYPVYNTRVSPPEMCALKTRTEF